MIRVLYKMTPLAMRTLYLMVAMTMTSCSNESTPQPASTAPAASPTVAEDANHGDVVRAKLTAGQIPTEYAAHFAAQQLTRIVETRHIGGTTLGGEYAFQGARLLHYRGAKLDDAASLDLQFDMQGALQSGQGPNISDEDIRAIRNRAQLLRSHALAQRATRDHSR
jgi:hypothetical protein